MAPPAARITDMHTCPMVTVLVPHVGGPIITGMPTVLTGFMPQARVTDMLVCVGPPDVIVKGSPTVLVGGLMAARIGDLTAHGGVIVTGFPTVLIGEAGGGGSSSGDTAVVEPLQFEGGDNPSGAGDAAAGGGGAPAVPTTYGNIKLDGTPAQRQKIIDALKQIESTPTGKAMIKSLNDSGKDITIKTTTGGNGARPLDSANAKRKADGTPGTGSGSVVSFNPDKQSVGDGSEPWMNRPPAVGLAHELVHADHSAHGTNDFTRTGEDMAVGNPPHDNQPFTENKIRNEWTPKQPQRPRY
jgi:uncharacterized Zn-binding protein involved in type VI secretion